MTLHASKKGDLPVHSVLHDTIGRSWHLIKKRFGAFLLFTLVLGQQAINEFEGRKNEEKNASQANGLKKLRSGLIHSSSCRAHKNSPLCNRH